MANQWLRLWHDMPNDPKWRTIARASKQPISLVIATYMHLLVSASRNVTRGHVDVTVEDVASALDVTDEEIAAIFAAMQGRVLDDSHLSGWDNRQVRREDEGSEQTGAKSAAERKREQREREKQAGNNAANESSHESSRNVTTDKDTDKEEDKEKTTSKALCDKPHKSQIVADAFDQFWNAFADKRSRSEALAAWKKISPSAELVETIVAAAGRYAAYRTAVLIPNQQTPKMAQGWLSGERWNDEISECLFSDEQKAFIDAYNANIGETLPTISADDWTAARAGKIDATLPKWDVAKWGEFFAWVRNNCEFKFSAGFDWLLTPENFAKVKSGDFCKKEVA